jgi:two-component sensor histidine kinase
LHQPTYLNNLVENLFRSYGVNQQNITFSIDITEHPWLTIDLAIPCGLIVNELISNALKHAFLNRSSGKINICLQNCELDNNLGNDIRVLTIRDNGVGLPPTVDWQTTSSLGLQIVRSLVKQLNGRVVLNLEAGTCFQIIFPLSPSAM